MDFSSRATAKDAEICCRRAYAFDFLAANNSITDKCEQNVYKSATAQNFSSVDAGTGLAHE